MAKAISDIRTEVRLYLDESAAADWLDSEVDLAINRAYHDVAGSVMEIYQDFYETTTPFTYAISANVQEYAIDSSLIKVTRVEVNYKPSDVNSLPVRAVPVKEGEVLGQLSNSSVQGSYMNPGYYLHGDIGAQKIGFIPVPTESDTTGKSISVWGIAMPSDLSDSNTNVNIPYADRFVYLISMRAAAQLMRKGQQEESNAGHYIEEYEKGISQMKTFLKERQSDGAEMIQDVLGEDTDFAVLDVF